MKYISNLFIIIGVIFLVFFGYQIVHGEVSKKNNLASAEEHITKEQQTSEDQRESKENINKEDKKKDKVEKEEKESAKEVTKEEKPQTTHGEAFATLEIPKLDKKLAIIEGTDEASLDKGVGHLTNSVYPGQGEQILLSGHRDTVFRDFDKIEIGDQFTVNMPDGSYTYEIKETEIVPEDDTTVIRSMGEEVLVVTTCYPFNFIGNAPERFVTYAYPVK